MTQTQHTPGPWTIDERGNVRADMPNDSDCILIAEVIYAPLGLDYEGVRTREMTHGEQKANAALIAAAPDMKAALVVARSYLVPVAMEGTHAQKDLQNIDAILKGLEG